MNNTNLADLTGILLITGLIGLKVLGMNGMIDSSLALIVGYYFGRRNLLNEQKDV
jgi:hypothetical protein